MNPPDPVLDYGLKGESLPGPRDSKLAIASLVAAFAVCPWILFRILFASVEKILIDAGLPSHHFVNRVAWFILMLPTVGGLLLPVIALRRIGRSPSKLRGAWIAIGSICLYLTWICVGLFILVFGILFWEDFGRD